MKSKITQQVRVGIFVFLGLILSMLVIFLLGGGTGFFERKFELFARFEDISGLRLGAPVFLAGIQVGKVEGVVFPTNLEEREVMVRMEISKKYQDRIRKDSEASIVTQGLLGDKAVFITMGTPASDELKDDEYITVKQGMSLDSFAKKGGDLLDGFLKLAENVDGLVTDIKEKEGLMHAIIYDPEGSQLVKDLANVTDNANQIMREVQSGRGMLHAMIYDPVRKDIGKLFSDTAENFRTLSKDMAAIGASVEKGEGSVGGLIKDPSVYYDLMTLLGKANRNKLLRTVIRATLATNEKDLIKE